MSTAGFILGLGALVALSYHYWIELFETESEVARREVIVWSLKGLACPLFWWAACNFGILPGVSPLHPGTYEVTSKGFARIQDLVEVLSPTMLCITLFWAAVTFAWMFGELLRRVEDHREILVLAGVWVLVSSPLAWVIWRSYYSAGLSGIVLLWLVPIVHVGLAFVTTREPHPIYSRAIAKLKMGKYRQAEQEVIQELEKKSDDIEGWLMLAEIYANRFHDLRSAEQTILDLCAQPNLPPAQMVLACHRLADWQLKGGEDPAAARRALDVICVKLPGSHFARMAQLRMDQLPADREELHEQKEVKAIRLPALNDSLDADGPPDCPQISRKEAAARANKYVAKLKRNPNHVGAREEFAVLLAEYLGKCELAIEQLQLLLEMPDQPERKRAEWLGLMAAWHLRHHHDQATARPLLERIIREFPRLPQAIAARRRLELMEVEAMMRAMGPVQAHRVLKPILEKQPGKS